MKKGKFIVFEGLDGSGTSTQSQLLQNALLEKGEKVHLTCEPSPGPIGNMIRQAMQGRILFSKQDDKFDQQMAYLFAADRYDHLNNPVDGVLKLVNEGFFVISTRYFFSSLAYHVTDNDSCQLVERLNSEFPNPDLLIYLDNPVESSLKRLNSRTVLDKYEEENKLKIVSENYQKIISKYNGEKLVLSALDSKENIHTEIIKKVESI
ncbi:dTMP kinase [Acinetobacter baumannii]|uniref:dTMP kinase n=1 Tax=Acinetobacter baumannii TaxID=470 RepID=UPI000616FDDE|nr:dTMP kinase [Acinetobacter baumannii]MBD0442183.1 dTMP kinase [Acinetobacter baumannii]MCR6569963.1 dTMP kinase [Acinetobacter baumannii]MCW3181520.1 dTMP kinase [Acinetobacter baumannii]MDV4324053.1 dTMP kinase [Acinetobacter baumannii]MDV4338486.1 dTMP kinase [Acinetobacter baumannii]